MPSEIGNTIPNDPQFIDRALYSPIVIAVYCALISFLAGFILYGINLYRRGQIWFGRLFIGLSVFVFIGAMITAFMGNRILDGKSYIFSIIIAVGLYRMESAPYAKALSLGAMKAKWWPPLLWSLFIITVTVLALSFFGLEEE